MGTNARASPHVARIAGWIRDRLLANRDAAWATVAALIDEPADWAQHYRRLRRQLDLCRQHQLPRALARIEEHLLRHLHALPAVAERANRPLPPEYFVPSQGDLAAELRQIEGEFPQWSYHRAEHTLTATTVPITLEDQELGAFAIELKIDRLGRTGPPYRVRALAPNRPVRDSAVTHPHVSDGHLCEGEAAVPIRAALAEGRLGDFFLLVRCVLETYNPGSAYVSLEHWNGIACHDCDSLIDDNDSCYCPRCDHDFCPDCISLCRCCEESACRSCLESCAVCRQRTCSHCLHACTACGEDVCETCLDGGVCPRCLPTSDEGTDHEPAPDPATDGPADGTLIPQAA